MFATLATRPSTGTRRTTGVSDKDFERRLALYGMTLNDYSRLEIAQNYRCAICGKVRKQLEKRFAVDHDHRTGRVRGLLCGGCNYTLGQLHESREWLSSAVAYLDKPPATLVFNTPRRHVNAPPEEDTWRTTSTPSGASASS